MLGAERVAVEPFGLAIRIDAPSPATTTAT